MRFESPATSRPDRSTSRVVVKCVARTSTPGALKLLDPVGAVGSSIVPEYRADSRFADVQITPCRTPAPGDESRSGAFFCSRRVVPRGYKVNESTSPHVPDGPDGRDGRDGRSPHDSAAGRAKSSEHRGSPLAIDADATIDRRVGIDRPVSPPPSGWPKRGRESTDFTQPSLRSIRSRNRRGSIPGRGAASVCRARRRVGTRKNPRS